MHLFQMHLFQLFYSIRVGLQFLTQTITEPFHLENKNHNKFPFKS